MKIAIMQPYFMPYAGYFRLMAAADLFVIYDCVQFPRRGWVHRNKLHLAGGESDWLTLPLAKGERDSTRIMDLQFLPDAQALWRERLRAFPAIRPERQTELFASVATLDISPCDYMVRNLKHACNLLGISCEWAYSSSLNVPAELRAQDRILAIAKHFGATDYINSPGGRALYEESAFADQGINLHFLPDYKGAMTSILERLMLEDPKAIAAEIRANL